MWRLLRPPEGKSRAGAAFWRDRIAKLLALVTVVCLAAAFIASDGTTFLMPGPLTSAHRAIKNCSACHSKSGSGKLSWIHSAISGDRLTDSKACLKCHKMLATAFFPHGASADVLIRSTKRLTSIAVKTPAPLSARAQSFAFPTRDVVARGLYCSACHQEHRGANFNLSKISNEQCRSCHVIKFDSFDGDHPQFDHYPFKRRTRIIYDHSAHFDKHYPEVAKKDAAKRIPVTCSTCHDSGGDKRIMAVAPFEKTCSGCHLDQITGKERVSGPKGIAFLTLPGLDLQILKKKKVPIGEWPETSEAELTPFMKMMISRSDRGRSLIKTVSGLNLQDLSNATDDQIAAVNGLVWEIKRLLYALISGKTSGVLGDLNFGNGARPSVALVADLTARIPRDVIVGAQQEWLPHLATEIASGPIGGAEEKRDLQSAGTVSRPSAPIPPEEPPAPNTRRTTATPSAARQTPAKSAVDPPGCLVRILGQCLVAKGPDDEAKAAKSDNPAEPTDSGNADDRKKHSSSAELPAAMHAGLGGGDPSAPPDGANRKKRLAEAEAQATRKSPPSDDLLFPTEEELREMKAHRMLSGRKSETEPPADVRANSSIQTAAPNANGAPVMSIASDVDPETWAEYGGWYRQNYTIFYRPTGHKDKFIYSWLFLTGPHALKGDKNPAAAIFDALTGKDAQGACTKCHSVDDIPGGGRIVNFSPLSVADKQGRFTNFIHEPHFAVVGARGCLTCHSLEKERPYLKSYEQRNPESFASNFSALKKDVCQSCHATNLVRQDCLSCHTYHVNGVLTPIVNTKNPIP